MRLSFWVKKDARRDALVGQLETVLGDEGASIKRAGVEKGSLRRRFAVEGVDRDRLVALLTELDPDWETYALVDGP